MRYIGFDMGDGESAVAAFEHNSVIEPVILPVSGARSLLSAVGLIAGEIVVGERAYTDALADGLSVRFKSRFTSDPASYEDIVRFARGVMRDLMDSGSLTMEDRFVVGCPAGWNAACRARYRDLLMRAGVYLPQVISESRAAFLYAKYARTVAMDVDVLNESALVVDIGSSTLDFAYIVDGRETGVGTFGETELGGGILDAALLRRALERYRERKTIQAVFDECRSWYSYCELEARRVKEAYFTRLAEENAPVVTKSLRICYDGVQKLVLQMDNEETDHLVNDPLPELDGRSFAEAVHSALTNAARITADRPPKLLLLTGGASRMPFFRDLCREVFESAIVLCCPEPEFSIAKGLAYAGWVDENLHAFRQAIRDEISDAQISAIAQGGMDILLPAVSEALSNLLLDEAILPVAEQWKQGSLATMAEMNDLIGKRATCVLASPLAAEALAPALQSWLAKLTEPLQALINPICDRYDIPRKQMKLNLAAVGEGIIINAGEFTQSNFAGTVLGLTISLLTGALCGGGGIALITSGPLGFLAGIAIGAILSLLGQGTLTRALSHVHVPLLIRQGLPIEKRLCSENTHHRLAAAIQKELSHSESPFQTQLADNFTKAFRGYINSIAQAAEIPIA